MLALLDPLDDPPAPLPEAIPVRRTVGIYLAGGTETHWREKVKEFALDHFGAKPPIIWYDPVDLKRERPGEATGGRIETLRREEGWLRSADVVFAYAEAESPEPFGLALNIGFMRAQGRPVILVDEHQAGGSEWLSGWSDYVTPSLEEGMAALMWYAERYVGMRYTPRPWEG